MTLPARKPLTTGWGNPFDLADDNAYAVWRSRKLAEYPRRVDDLFVEIRDPGHLSMGEREAIRSRIRVANMALYATATGGNTDKAIPREIARQLRLNQLDHHLCVDDDGISPIQVSNNEVRQDYIPYTNRPINWHTDGYYHPSGHHIRGMVLHCVNDALRGGENFFVDHEIIYILLRDAHPASISALMQVDAMTIPENVHNGEMIRPAVTGPVFSVTGDPPRLHMRYTARQHSIEWKQDPVLLHAVSLVSKLLADNSEWIFRHRLAPGQGIICNNVLHKRSGFDDGNTVEKMRLLYRARYCDRVD